MSYSDLMMNRWGIPTGLIIIFLVWALVWKLLALWKSARRKSVIWFIVLALINTLGILEILYLFVFSEMKPQKAERKVKRKRRR